MVAQITEEKTKARTMDLSEWMVWPKRGHTFGDAHGGSERTRAWVSRECIGSA